MSELDLIPNDETEAINNIERLTESFAAKQTVRVTQPGNYHFNGTARTPFTGGCGRIESDAGFTYTLGGNPQFTGQVVRFVQHATAPLLRLNGTGFIFNGGIELVGDSFSSAIEVSGNQFIATGRHRFRDICFSNWARCFDALNGYYDPTSGEFVEDENHADNCRITTCESFDCPTFFRSLSQQAIFWKFDQCIVNKLVLDSPQIVADIQRGGCVTFISLAIEHPQTTLFKIKDFSPNNCKLNCHDMFVDRLWDDPTSYLELVHYAGNFLGTWCIDIDGFVGNFASSFPKSRLYNAPSTLPRKKWNVRLTGEPAF